MLSTLTCKLRMGVLEADCLDLKPNSVLLRWQLSKVKEVEHGPVWRKGSGIQESKEVEAGGKLVCLGEQACPSLGESNMR